MNNKLAFRHLRQVSTLLGSSLLLVLLVLGSCRKKDDGNPASTDPVTIKLTNSPTLGNILTDGQGNTLYQFALDVTGSNSCAGGCTATWPVFYTAAITVSQGLNAADFTTSKTADGRDQTLYKGWPLYYFAPPANGQNVREPAGATGGEGIGRVWYVARPDYSVLVARNNVLNKSTNVTSSKAYLADPQGRTLYTFGKDSRLPATQPTNCQGGCLTAWPVFYQANIVAPSFLKASDFGTITRPDGPNGTTQLQTTYKGMPLYYFSADNSMRGKAEGDGIPAGSDAWSVAIP